MFKTASGERSHPPTRPWHGTGPFEQTPLPATALWTCEDHAATRTLQAGEVAATIAALNQDLISITPLPRTATASSDLQIQAGSTKPPAPPAPYSVPLPYAGYVTHTPNPAPTPVPAKALDCFAIPTRDNAHLLYKCVSGFKLPAPTRFSSRFYYKDASRNPCA